MPEIAEVHLNTDLILKPFLKGEQLVDIEILSGKYIKKKPDNFDDFQNSLPSKIGKIENKGKFTWFTLKNGWSVGFGLGMTGRLVDEEENHSRLRLENSKGEELWYVDQRNFGNWYFYPDQDGLKKKLNTLGIDFLNQKKVTKKKIVEAFRKHDKKEISKVLLDQSVLAGVGNYLRAEMMYGAQVYPFAKVADLTDTVLYKLYQQGVKWAEMAYNNQRGLFLDGVPYSNFQEKMQVYNQETDLKGNKVTRTKQSGRTVHWVSKIQTVGKK